MLTVLHANSRLQLLLGFLLGIGFGFLLPAVGEFTPDFCADAVGKQRCLGPVGGVGLRGDADKTSVRSRKCASGKIGRSRGSSDGV